MAKDKPTDMLTERVIDRVKRELKELQEEYGKVCGELSYLERENEIAEKEARKERSDRQQANERRQTKLLFPSIEDYLKQYSEDEDDDYIDDDDVPLITTSLFYLADRGIIKINI